MGLQPHESTLGLHSYGKISINIWSDHVVTLCYELAKSKTKPTTKEGNVEHDIEYEIHANNRDGSSTRTTTNNHSTCTPISWAPAHDCAPATPTQIAGMEWGTT